MDPTTNPDMNGTHLTRENNNASYNSFLNGINHFVDPSDLQSGNDDFPDQFFDPALFENSNSSNTYTQGFSQQPAPFQPSYDQNPPRQSASPAVPQYNPQQAQYSHSQFPQPVFDSRNMAQSQQTFDPRFMQQRPSHSPGSLDNYQYQPLNFSNQPYNPQQLTIQQRQSATPTPNYPPRQQQIPQYMNFGGPGSQLLQGRTQDMMQYPGYPEHHQPTHSFVDPAMLSSSQLSSLNGTQPGFSSHPQYPQPPYYPKSGITVDLRSLQGGLVPQPTPPTGVQQPQAQQGMQGVIKPDVASRPKVLKDPHAPKKSKAKSSKDGAKPKTNGSVSDSDSDDLSVDNEEPPEVTPAVLSVSAPTDERGKALYNAVQAVWSPRNKPASPEKIRSGLALFGETVRNLRDAWRVKAESLKQAELPSAKTAGEIPTLKSEVAHYRQVMEGVMTRSLQYAHPAVLKRLGENIFTMSALHSFLLDRFNAADFDSPLILNILKFAVNFQTLDEEQLEKTKWAKILSRFAKKSTNDSKSLAQAILTNASSVSAKKKTESKSEKVASPMSISDASDVAKQDPLTGLKRSRDGDAAVPPVAKKPLVKPSSKPLALQNEERRRAQEAAQASNKSEKRPTLTNGIQSSSATKSKIAVTAPPKSAMFSSLLSASKRPGTSNAARAAAAKGAPTTTPGQQAPAGAQLKREPANKESPPRNLGPAAAKGNSVLLGFLADMDKKEEVKPKQEEEIPNETEEEKQKRLRKEGRRRLRVSWKPDADLVETRHFTHDPDEEIGHADSMMRDAGDTVKEGEMLKLHKGLEDLDDDEDDDAQEVDDNYTLPSEVDFSDVENIIDNTTRFGGPNKPESASRDAQDKLEENTLMVVYDSQADRPATPKEALDEGDDPEFQPCVDFGEPGPITRDREKEFLSRKPIGHDMNGMNLATQMQALQSNQQQPGMIATDLQRTLGMLGQPAAAHQPAPAATLDLQRLIATVAQVSQMQYQPAPTATGTPANSNLSALLAQIQQSSQGLPLGAGGNPNPFPGVEDQSRKHGRTDSGNDINPDYDRDGGNKKKKVGNAPKVDEAIPYNYKTQTCSFWKQNKCIKGDSCTYRHDDD